MAHVKVTGRLGRDVLSFNNDNGSKTHLLNIAVPRTYANKETGEYEADFIQVKAFTNSVKAHAFYENNMKKGRLVEVEANFSSNTFMKDGERKYVVDIIVDNINPFHEKISNQARRESSQAQQATQTQQPATQTQQAGAYAPQGNMAPPVAPMPQMPPNFYQQ